MKVTETVLSTHEEHLTYHRSSNLDLQLLDLMSLPHIDSLASLELLCLIYLRASTSPEYLRIKIHTAMPDGVN